MAALFDGLLSGGVPCYRVKKSPGSGAVVGGVTEVDVDDERAGCLPDAVIIGRSYIFGWADRGRRTAYIVFVLYILKETEECSVLPFIA